MVLVVGQNSVWQKTYNFTQLNHGEVNRVREVFESAAGKGSNVVRSISCFDVPATLLAYTGGTIGEKFKKACAVDDGLNCVFVPIANETRICTTLLEDSGAMTELVEPAPEITIAERDSYLHNLVQLMENANFLSIAGTAVSGEDADCYKIFIKRAHEQSIPVLLDSYTLHGKNALPAGPEILKINLQEFQELYGTPLTDQSAKISAYSKIRDKFNIQWIVITKGKDGVEGFNGKAFVQVKPSPVKAENPIGSGDSSSSGLLYGILQYYHNINYSGDIDWDSTDLLLSAVKHSAAFGTANCMNKKPGYIIREDFETVYSSLEIKQEF